ncbi:hypothetical protein QFZ81_003731 [Paenibacillus sp. V4I9]|uniref:hypothetical protein n=1 Tax=Paenibacillus sp. V4I9 TaxID=3042308 RepID=UPI002784FAC8|nr:hypothetical protein [Paenibacillus sp. V4I9]MDQ0888643.1 hypothetical protein [Paenibacillus sp. V4I9]
MNKTYEQLQKLVSPRYKHIIPKGTGVVNGFIFEDDEVVLSSVVNKALKKVNLNLNDEFKKLAIGYNFTFESIQLLHEYKFDVVSLRDFPWTDERYKAIKGSNR